MSNSLFFPHAKLAYILRCAQFDTSGEIPWHAELYPSGIRWKAPKPGKIILADFDLEADSDGKPIQITCPKGQKASIGPGSYYDHIANFDADICLKCPFHLNGYCSALRVKRDRSQFHGVFSQQDFLRALRRERYQWLKQLNFNPRAAFVTALPSINHAYPHGKLPVRGQVQVSRMMILAAAMTNLRRITQYQLE